MLKDLPKGVRIALLAAAGFALLLVVAVIGAIGYVRSESGSRLILAKAQAAAKAQGAELTFAKGRVDVFSGLTFVDLKVVRAQGGDRLEVAIPRLELAYDFSIFGRRVEVSKFLIDHPKILFRSRSDEVPAPKAAPTGTAAAPAGGASTLHDWIAKPAVQVIVKGVALDGLDVDVDIQDPASSTRASIRGLSAHTELESVRGRITADGDLDLGRIGQVILKSAAAKTILDSVRGSAKWSFRIEPGSGRDSNGGVTLVKADSQAAFKLGRLDMESAQGAPIGVGSQELKIQSALSQGGDVGLKAAYQAHGVSMPGTLKGPVDARFSANVHAPQNLRDASGEVALQLGELELLKVGFKASVGPGPAPDQLTVTSKIALNPDPKLARIVPAAAAGLKQVGWLDPAVDLNVTLAGAYGTLADVGAGFARQPLEIKTAVAVTQKKAGTIHLNPLKVDAAVNLDPVSRVTKVDLHSTYSPWKVSSQVQLKMGTGRLETSGSTTIAQAGDAGLPVTLVEPILLTHEVKLDNSSPEHPKTDGHIEISLPSLVVRDLGKVLATHVDMIAKTQAEDVDFDLDLKQGDILPTGDLGKKFPKLAGLEARGHAKLSGGDRFALDRMTASIGGGLFSFSADASGRVKSKDFDARGAVNVNVPSDFPAVIGQKIRGSLEAPWTLAVVKGAELDLDGAMSIKSFSAMGPVGGMTGMTGRIPFSERLRWDGKHARFSHLITQNPFERVDFDRVRPLIEGADQVRIDQLHWLEKSYGPLVGYFSLKQNMLQIQKLDLAMGSGKIYGEMFLNAYPKTLQLGMLTRITGLDFTEIFPAKYLEHLPEGDKAVSGRCGMVIDLNKRSVDGRVDLTEIGSSQLSTMVNLMDPHFENASMNRLRKGLSLGAPTYVGMRMDEGFLDMDVEGLPIPMPTIRGIALSSWIDRFTGDAIKKTEEGPLE